MQNDSVLRDAKERLTVLPYLFSLSAQEEQIYQLIVYAVLFLLLLLFYVKGKGWRSWFQSMQSGMITFMAEVVENRDDNTGGHIRRTAE